MKYVLVSGGVVVQVDMTANPPEGYIPAGDDVYPGYIYTEETNSFTAPVVNELPQLPRPELVASALFTITDGYLGGADNASGVAFAFALTTGVFIVFFTEEMPDLNYSWNANASEGQVISVVRDTTSITISVAVDGSPVDPPELSLQIFRNK